MKFPLCAFDWHIFSWIHSVQNWIIFRAIYDTPSIQENDQEKLQTLKNVALFIVLSPYDSEQSNQIHLILKEKSLNEIPKYKSLLEQFINQELIDQKKLVQIYGPELKQGSKDSPPTEVFNDKTEEGRKRWDDLKSRVVEHNIRIMAKYYTRVSLKRMAELVSLEMHSMEFFCQTDFTWNQFLENLEVLNVPFLLFLGLWI